MTGSLEYRKNEAAILRGEVPVKYTRIVPHVPGFSVIELGSAEGVLALMLARAGKRVHAIEASAERHDAAIELARTWGDLQLLPTGTHVTFINDRAEAAVAAMLPGEFDTLVAVRMIYYLREHIDEVFSVIAGKVRNVVLCGNRNRAAQWRQGIPDKPGGPLNYYASHEGMARLLERHGYFVSTEITDDGDPLVVGCRGG